MGIMLYDEQDALALTDELSGAMQRVAEQVEKSVGFPVEAAVLLTDDGAIHALNMQFRQVDRPTDVLSFPAYELDGALLADVIGSMEVERVEGKIWLGDIAISTPRAIAQAQEYGHSVKRELAFLVVHGMLHLLGYDHMAAQDEKAMLAKQDEILSDAGIGREESCQSSNGRQNLQNP